MAIPCKLDPIGLFGLPSNYVRLKYLRSDGYQYIDTLYKATLNTAIHVQFTPLNTAYKAVAGMRTDLTGANININVGNQSATANLLTDFNYRNNSRHYAFVPDFNNVYNTLLYDVYLDRFNSKVNVYKDGEPYFEASHSYNVDYFDDSKSANIALFSNNVSMGNSGGGFIGKIYGCKIKDGDIVVRNFIPALAPHDKDGNPTPYGTPCMFDTVTHIPFFNKGNFDFLYGMVEPPSLNQSADNLWELAKNGAFDEMDIFYLADDVLICFGNVDLPGNMELPEKLRFVTNKTILDRAFQNNNYVKNLTIYCRNKITSCQRLINGSAIQYLDFSARLGGDVSNTAHYGGLPASFALSNVIDIKCHILSNYTSPSIGVAEFAAYNSNIKSFTLDSPVAIGINGIQYAWAGNQNMTDLAIGDKITIKYIGWSRVSATNTVTNSPLTIESVKSLTKLYLRSPDFIPSNFTVCYMSIGKASNIASGNLTEKKHLNDDGTESEMQWSTTYNNVTYYANKDLWTCLMLIYGTDTLTLDGISYTGKGFATNSKFYFI